MLKLTAEDHAKVSAAIAAAEEKSAGEIIAVTTELSDKYHDVGLHYAVLVMFAALAVFAAAPNQLVWWYERLLPWAGEPSLQQVLTWVLFIALAKFLAVLFILKWMPLRLALTPRSTKVRRVRRRAVELFRTSAESRTEGRTGILIYLSMGEHRAEIIGDEAITAVTTDETWGEAMAALIAEVKQGRPGDGIAAAVAIVGDVLARHFPRKADDINEIPDKLIEL